MSDDILMPREKAIRYGINSLTNNELLALIIKSGYKNSNVFSLVDDIILRSNGFDNILNLTFEELIDIKGIKKAKAMEILAILEIAKRLSSIDTINEDTLINPDKVVEWLRFNIGFLDHEEFFAVYVNSKGKVLKYESLFKGSKNSSIVSVDQVLRMAILLKASAIFVAHNHPGGKVSPSCQDMELTAKLSSACKLMDIPLLDHVIISKSDYFSFKKHNLL